MQKSLGLSFYPFSHLFYTTMGLEVDHENITLFIGPMDFSLRDLGPHGPGWSRGYGAGRFLCGLI
jgi:hypothetical protein